ncbi:PilZ domain-containing protein [Novosphingobium sp. G106]|uniref:PilZ domain-containing protein n=1 Tax=Novosphingobium sp. G106 TaxID=2849500 RepID=UPI0020C2D694|nr:PilZ domain-containing protein [Novosphingobium sp. G106]
MTHQPKSNELGCTRGFSERAEIALVCEVRQGMNPWRMARLADMSPAGFQIALLPGARREVPLKIRIPGLAMLTAHIRWQRENVVGCEFAEPLHVAVFDHIVRQATGA